MNVTTFLIFFVKFPFILSNKSTLKTKACESSCEEGLSENTTECFVSTGCNLTFPGGTFLNDISRYLTMELSFKAYNDGVPYQMNFVYNILSLDILPPNDRFQVHFNDSSCQTDPHETKIHENCLVHYNLSITDISPKDSGRFDIKIFSFIQDYKYSSTPELIMHHTYRLIAVYRPQSAVECRVEDLSSLASKVPLFYLTCSVKKAYPPMDINILPTEYCDLRKYFSSNATHRTITAFVSSCGNASLFCIARQGNLHISSVGNSFTDSCTFDLASSGNMKIDSFTEYTKISQNVHKEFPVVETVTLALLAIGVFCGVAFALVKRKRVTDNLKTHNTGRAQNLEMTSHRLADGRSRLDPLPKPYLSTEDIQKVADGEIYNEIGYTSCNPRSTYWTKIARKERSLSA